MLKNWYNSTTIHLLSVSIFHNNMPTRTKSINEGLSQKVLTEMIPEFVWIYDNRHSPEYVSYKFTRQVNECISRDGLIQNAAKDVT